MAEVLGRGVLERVLQQGNFGISLSGMKTSCILHTVRVTDCFMYC